MDEDFIRQRITELRIQKNVSEYRMSLDLGHSKSYVQSITSGRALPSMPEFLYICEYFGITPADFFHTDSREILMQQELDNETKNMSKDDLNLLIKLAKRLNKK